AIAIAIGVGWVGAGSVFLRIGETVVVGVASRAIRTSGVIRVQAVASFPAIGQAIAIAIGVLRIGAVRVFLRIGQAIAVGVASRAIVASRTFWVEREAGLPAIRQRIAISIGALRICSGRKFLRVGERIT